MVNSLNRHLFHFFALGVSSGIPFLLVLSTLSFRLSESHVSSTVIGLLTLVTVPYSLKFLWTPFLDTLAHRLFDNHFNGYKAIGGVAQLLLVVSIACVGFCDPESHLILLAVSAICLSFFAATQDIIIDVLRVELTNEQQIGVSAAAETIGFRIGMLIGGAATLYLANIYDWKIAYCIIAVCQLIAIPALLFVPHQKHVQETQTIINQRKSLIQSLRDSLSKLNERSPLIYLILFILFFKIADTVLNTMSAPFLYDLGFDKIEYANITKTFGISLMIFGGIAAGYLMHHMDYLFVVGVSLFLQIVSCFLFVIQSWVGYDLSILTITIGVESFASGMAAAAFIAFISLYCFAPFSATHFTFLYTMGSVGRLLSSSISGWAADLVGWEWLFFSSACLTIPAFYFLIKVKELKKNEQITTN